MHAQAFRKRVEDFAQQYCQPHMQRYRIDWNLKLDRPRATVRCEDRQAIHWEIPMEVAVDDPERLVILWSGEEGLEASQEGFFTFIWYSSGNLTHGVSGP